MSDLSKRIVAELRAFVPAVGAQGSSGTLDREALRSRMKEVHQDTRRLFFFAGGMTAVVFVVLVRFIILYREHQAVVVGISGAMGLTIAASIDRMSRLAKELANASLIIHLCSTLNGEQAFKVIQALVAKQ
jgi:hypothetical protein